ncbi:MAG: peptidase M20, partial [Gammaproteobacteria bacterium]
ATASVGVRLVPNLTPHNIQEPIEQHLREQGYTVVHAPPDDAVRAQQEKIVLVSWHEDGYPAFRTPMHSVEAETLTVIMDEITDGELVRMPTMGGSLPLSLIEKHLEVPIVILPIANHDNNQHGENENIRIGNLWKAIEINAAVIATFGDRITGIND